MVDASGSMSLSTDALHALLRASPGATIAYYCAEGDEQDSQGELSVWARRGRAFTGADLPRCGVGNAIDLAAIRWLLEQPEPRVMVTDRGFCGGPRAEVAAAHYELARAVARGEVEVKIPK